MAADHFREWKSWQLKDRDKESWMLQSRRDGLAAQYEPKEAALQKTINRVDSEPLDPELIRNFKAAVRETQTPASNANSDPPAESQPARAAQVFD